jgi:hypothetical protein
MVLGLADWSFDGSSLYHMPRLQLSGKRCESASPFMQVNQGYVEAHLQLCGRTPVSLLSFLAHLLGV